MMEIMRVHDIRTVDIYLLIKIIEIIDSSWWYLWNIIMNVRVAVSSNRSRQWGIQEKTNGKTPEERQKNCHMTMYQQIYLFTDRDKIVWDSRFLKTRKLGLSGGRTSQGRGKYPPERLLESFPKGTYIHRYYQGRKMSAVHRESPVYSKWQIIWFIALWSPSWKS